MLNERKIAIRTGIFIILAVVGFIVIIFTVGSKRGYFQKKIALKASFTNVQGLWLGSPVRLAGVGVGKIIDVNFPDLSTKQVEVVMEINDNIRNLIRKDSSATIKWLSYVTGDSFIELTIGSEKVPMVEDGDILKSVEPLDFANVFEDGLSVLSIVKNGLSSLESSGFFSLIGDVTKQMSESLHDIKTGSGLLHALIYEPAGSEIVNNFSDSTKSLKNILAAVENGEGDVHQLVYGKTISDTLSNFKGISADVKDVVSNIKNSDGLLHAFLYDNKKKDMLSDFGKVTENLKELTEKINNGEGSLGAIINDPTLYDNIKALLGGAEQSFILKRLIRRSINKGNAD